MSESLIQMQRKLVDVTSKLEKAERELAEAQATLAKLRKQEPVARVTHSYEFGGGSYFNVQWLNPPATIAGAELYATPIPAAPAEHVLPAVPEEWREVMTELADDLAIEIDQSYPPERRAYPSEQRRYEREMEIVNRARALLQSAPQAPAVPEEWRESTTAMLLSLDEAIRAGNAVYVRQSDKVANHRHCWMRFHEKRQVVEALLQSAEGCSSHSERGAP